MVRCTAPVQGHRSNSARENCPACGGRGNYSYSRSNEYNFSSYSNSYTKSSNSSPKQTKQKANWSPSNSTVVYSPSEIRTLTPIRKNVEKKSEQLDLRDIFICHAWDDRRGAAQELYDLLKSKGVSVWFSEKDVVLGTSLMREIDKGIAKSRAGIVLVTPAFLERIKGEGVADKELSALLATDLLVPIVHNTTFDDLRDVSPLLGSRSGLSTIEDSIDIIADKLAELVTL